MNKMSCLVLTLLSTISLILTGCGSIYKTTYDFIPPKSFRARQCINQCITHRRTCNELCRKNHQICRSMAERAAMSLYYEYIQERREQKRSIRKNISNFADYSRCSLKCEYCNVDYRNCYHLCGGQVNENQVCVAFCK